MKITIVAVGKIKEKFYRDAIAEFDKRLNKYCKLNIVEVADEMTPDNASEADENLIKKKEGERLLKVIDNKAYVIALVIQGEQPDSVALSRKINRLCVDGNSHIVFVIGGSLGLSSDVTARANEQLSFSNMTFPHQLMRVILLEQIYRSFRILQNEPYHK